jgi:hypothetical protein
VIDNADVEAIIID